MIRTSKILLSTGGDADCQDVTTLVERAVSESGLNSGIITIFCPSSTSSLTTIEYESGAVSDLRRVLDEVVPPAREYAHNARWGDGNGHSHVRAALLGPSLTIPFTDGELTLGTWQQVVHLDFDIRPRQRELIVQVIGE